MPGWWHTRAGVSLREPMSTNATGRENGHDDRSIDDRDVRALTERMGVLDADTPGLYTVIGQNDGGEYTTDPELGACTCDDATYRDPAGGCKHVRRVRFATGERAVPATVDRDAVDDLLGAHLPDGGPRFAATDGGIVDAGDEGVILDESEGAESPTYTYHTEPARVGGARYVRCERCGAECVPADPDRLAHFEGCPEERR